LADTSGIIALLDRSDRHHTAVGGAIRDRTLWVPSTILPEVDYLATKYLGAKATRAFLEDLTQGAFHYVSVESIDLKLAVQLIQQYQDVPLGVVDASLVALAERYKIKQILTLDRRHFNLIQPQTLEYFELLP
jgi:hypothetical protein